MAAPCSAQMSLDEAHQLVRGRAQPLEVETVGMDHADERVLAQALHARLDSPRRDVAAMDGFALQDVAIREGRRVFDIVGATYAGDAAGEAIDRNTTYRVMTGANVPGAADRVIPFELVEERDGKIHLAEEISPSRHVRSRANDFRAGEILLEPGTLLDPPRMLVACASDQSTIPVYRRPRVSLIASGDELVTSGTATESPSKIPDSLTRPLLLFAGRWGAATDVSMLLGDDALAIGNAARAALAFSDILILVGGAASGARDLARPALASHGLELVFAGVAIKPGKPVWYGKLGSAHVLGLPGNPAAAMMVARLFLAPLICALGGRGFDAALNWRIAPLKRPLEANGPREMFLFARRDGEEVDIIDRQSASTQRSLAVADMIIRRPSGAAALERGVSVPVLDL
jgi:molybdopterin molybdotransferase